MYFLLKPDHGKVQEVSIRRLPLQGAINFRDLGGYATTDGLFVRWGRLYRSSELGHLTESDLGYLQQLKVRLICDFRTGEERKHLADRWPASPQADTASFPIGDGSGKNSASLQTLQRLLAQDPQPDRLRDEMTSLYREMAIDGAPEFSGAIREIANGHLPFVFHCTAGKDRTGIFSAILLRILGVPAGTVMSDYLLSNQYLLTPESVSRMQASLHAAMPNTPPLNPDAIHVLLGVDKAYLSAALAAIDEKYGSFDNYRRTALHLSDADVRLLRSQLLIP
jgi:protein-tyrosine phosphatase